jgi:hypothetical protein
MATKKTKKPKRGSIASGEFNVIKLLLLVSLLGISAFAVVSRVVNRNKALWKPSKRGLCIRPSLNQTDAYGVLSVRQQRHAPSKLFFR